MLMLGSVFMKKQNKNENKYKSIYNIIFYIILVVVCVVSFIFGMKYAGNKEDTKTDAVKFASEYPVSEDNVFVYRSLEEINKILKNGSGIIFLGFPECPWCRGYAPIINEVAKQEKLEKVYYFNIKKDREDNSELYQETVKLLGDNLRYDDEGNRRIYAPSLIAVKNGKIVGFDDTRYWNNKSYETPEDFWNKEDLTSMKEKLVKMITDTKDQSYCTADCD